MWSDRAASSALAKAGTLARAGVPGHPETLLLASSHCRASERADVGLDERDAAPPGGGRRLAAAAEALLDDDLAGGRNRYLDAAGDAPLGADVEAGLANRPVR
jgi:hypothetical protein